MGNLVRNRGFWQRNGLPCEEEDGGGGQSASRFPEVAATRLCFADVARDGWPAQCCDVVMGSDIIYGNWGKDVAKVASFLLRPQGCFIMMSAMDRGGLRGFQEAIEDDGFDVALSNWCDEELEES